MSLQIIYWKRIGPATHEEIKNIRLKRVSEVEELIQPHNIPRNCALVTLMRTDRQSNREKIVWGNED